MKYIVALVIVLLLSTIPSSKQDFNNTVTNNGTDNEIQAVVTKKPRKKPQPVIKSWTVRTSPHANVSVEKINTALKIYQDMGMSKQGTAYLVGNFIGESRLDHTNCLGDGGTACGLGQWRFNRQEGMPTEYKKQLKWAVSTEMIRDTPELRDVLFDHKASISDIQYWLERWERWGVIGDRWFHANSIYKQIR